jgi:DNA-binding response OmpR family regulator
VILILSSSARERSALLSLCESAGWVADGADSLRAARRALLRHEIRALVSREALDDGHADHLIRELASGTRGPAPGLVVLAGPAMPTAEEARLVLLGAECVLRDPVRTEVLLAHLSRLLRREAGARRRAADGRDRLAFAGGELRPDDRTLRRGRRAITLTPREAELAEALASRPGEVVTYETLYGEILGRRFRGDTSNLRVLLGKLAATCGRLGIELRDWIEVIPKAGHRYHPRRRRSTPA